MGSNVLHIGRVSRLWSPTAAPWEEKEGGEDRGEAGTERETVDDGRGDVLHGLDTDPQRLIDALLGPPAAKNAGGDVRDLGKHDEDSVEALEALLLAAAVEEEEGDEGDHVDPDAEHLLAMHGRALMRALAARAREDLVFAHCVPATDSAVVVFHGPGGAAAAEAVIHARGAERAAATGEHPHAAGLGLPPGGPRSPTRQNTARPGDGGSDTDDHAEEEEDDDDEGWVVISRGAPLELSDADLAGADGEQGYEQLEIPAINPVLWMSSPPSSPPESWEPSGEDINRIAHRDLESEPVEGTQDVVLLRGEDKVDGSRKTDSVDADKPSVPSIVVTLSSS
jgi:hypothetical protein